MAYRDDLIALTARHDALATEVATKTRELEASQQLLDEARSRARLPVLDNLRVATPCTARWDLMTGDDRVRHCDQCQKSVYNLSGMTRDEAEALVIERSGKLCARYYQRRDGTIVFSDCKRDDHHRWVAAGAAALLAAGLGAAGTLAQLSPPEQLPVPRVQLGTPPPPPPPAPAPPRHATPSRQAVPRQVSPQQASYELIQGGMMPVVDPPEESPPVHRVRHPEPTSVPPGKRAR
jgi:hypothetical protein